jgi:UDP-glucose 4-epimerase
MLERALRDIDIVIHLISTSVPATANLDILADVQNNVVATLRLLQACRQHKISKVLFASSGGTVYGIPKQLPIPEAHPTQPINAYGIAKLTIEHYLQLFYRLYGLGYIILRGANPYGERQNPLGAQGAVAVFLGQIYRNQPITLWGAGEVVRDYFYVGDMAQAFRLATESSLQQGTFNVGSGHGLSVQQLLDEISTVTGQTPNLIYQPARLADVPTNVLDIAHIQHTLGWQPVTPLAVGLARTWAWIKTLPR